MQRRKLAREKISTTISPESLAYFEKLIKAGEASTLAEAIDAAVGRLREADWRHENDAKLSAYYDSLTDDEVEEDRSWGELAGHSFLQQQEE